MILLCYLLRGWWRTR